MKNTKNIRLCQTEGHKINILKRKKLADSEFQDTKYTILLPSSIEIISCTKIICTKHYKENIIYVLVPWQNHKLNFEYQSDTLESTIYRIHKCYKCHNLQYIQMSQSSMHHPLYTYIKSGKPQLHDRAVTHPAEHTTCPGLPGCNSKKSACVAWSHNPVYYKLTCACSCVLNGWNRYSLLESRRKLFFFALNELYNFCRTIFKRLDDYHIIAIFIFRAWYFWK